MRFHTAMHLIPLIVNSYEKTNIDCISRLATNLLELWPSIQAHSDIFAWHPQKYSHQLAGAFQSQSLLANKRDSMPSIGTPLLNKVDSRIVLHRSSHHWVGSLRQPACFIRDAYLGQTNTYCPVPFIGLNSQQFDSECAKWWISWHRWVSVVNLKSHAHFNFGNTGDGCRRCKQCGRVLHA